MNRTKILLYGTAALLLVPAFFLGTTDKFSGSQNCGAALFPKDTSQLIQQSGDPIEDDFESEITQKQCDHEILRQRLLMAFVLVVALGLTITATRLKPRPERFPGDPIV